MRLSRHLLNGAKSESQRTRRLRFEPLEERICLVFRAFPVAGGMRLEGDWWWQGGTWHQSVRKDELHAVYWSAATATIHIVTDDEISPIDDVDTLIARPPAGGPFTITAYGYEGNDKVSVWLAAGKTNLAGFFAGSVSKFTFWGGDGDDTFDPPESAAGAMILPAAGASPNIFFNGGLGDDTLTNNADPEEFAGEGGRDKALLGGGTGGGDDIYSGGDDLDTLEGGIGNDSLSGGNHGDTIRGGAGNDTIAGGPGIDRLEGEADNDTITGDEDGDIIWGGTGNDTIQTGTSGAEDLSGLEGVPEGGFFEVAFGDDGMDQIDAISASGSAFLDGGWDGDLILGSNFGDTINGGTDDGWDTLFGFGGPDTMSGGPGNDELHSNDIVAGPDQPYGGLGPNPGWPDMMGTGDEGCNFVDEHDEGCPTSSGGGGGGGSGGGGALMVMAGGEGMEDCGCGGAAGKSKSAGKASSSSRLAQLLANHRLFELSDNGEWLVAKPVAKAISRAALVSPALEKMRRELVDRHSDSTPLLEDLGSTGRKQRGRDVDERNESLLVVEAGPGEIG